jgi:hypothetical protein
MELLPGQGLDLPPNLRTLHVITQTVINNARTYQSDINASSVSPGIKVDLVRKAVAALDKQSEACFLGKEVQIEGSYEYPVPVLDEGEFIIRAVSEYGIRRGQSLGFYGNVLPVFDGDGELKTDEVTVELSHGIVMAEMAFGNRLFSLNGRANINAPISKSSLVPCEIEDYRNNMFAEMFVRQTKRDSRWTDSIDEVLYKVNGPDLRALSTRLSRLRSIRGDRVEEYLTYINSKLGVESSTAIVLCDNLLVHGPDHQQPYVITPNELIEGHSPDICFADAYILEKGSNIARKSDKPTPTLSLRSTIAGKEGEHILHIPLSGIQYAEFK